MRDCCGKPAPTTRKLLILRLVTFRTSIKLLCSRSRMHPWSSTTLWLPACFRCCGFVSRQCPKFLGLSIALGNVAIRSIGQACRIFFRTVDADRTGKPKPLVISSTCPTAGAEAATEVPWHVARRSWSIVSHQSEGSAGECVRSHTRCWSRRCAGPASLQLPLLRESIQMLPCGLCCLSPRAPHTRS